METTTVKTVFQFRRATTDEWEIVNPILREGEPAYDITAKKHKIGDGKSKWNELPYAEVSGGISGDINWEQIVNAPTKLSQFENDLDIPDSSYIDTKLEQKADKDHNHDGVYQPVGDYLTEETDPTVPAWAKQAEKPMYTYEEIQNTPDLSGYAMTDYVDSEIEKVKSGIEKYDDTDVKNRISANEKSIEALSGNGEGSVKETVANAIAEVVNGAPEDFDTLKEVADWIKNDTTGAAKMESDIANLNEKVNNISSGKDPLFIAAQKFHNRPGTELAYDVDAKDFSRVASVGEKANLLITNAEDAEGVWSYFCEATVESIPLKDEEGNASIYAVRLSSICDLTPSNTGSLSVTSVNGKTGAVVLEASDIIKNSTDENKISISSDGTLEVNSITIDKLVQEETNELVIDGGNA